jgi:hypothetical protein
LVLPRLDRLLDGLDVEDDDVVLVARGHLGDRDPLLGVVAGRGDVLALIVPIVVVEVSADDHLPGNRHGVAVDGRENRAPLLRLVEILADVGDGNAVLAIAEDVARARIALQAQAVDGMGVRYLDDLVALHHIQTDAR